jgi:hypothetical protein
LFLVVVNQKRWIVEHCFIKMGTWSYCWSLCWCWNRMDWITYWRPYHIIDLTLPISSFVNGE